MDDDKGQPEAFHHGPPPSSAPVFSIPGLPMDPAIAAAFPPMASQPLTHYPPGTFPAGFGMVGASPPQHPPLPQLVRGNVNVEQIEAAMHHHAPRASMPMPHPGYTDQPSAKMDPHSGLRQPPPPGPHAHRRKRQLETLSMTDREIDSVLKMHARLIESSDQYKENYYSSISSKMYPYTSSVTTTAREDPAPHRPRPEHTARNLKVLATALGSVQSWTPRAPRKVVSFRKDETPGQRNLVREDERISIRKIIERGYDVLADLADFRRGRCIDASAAEEDFTGRVYILLELDIDSDLAVRVAALPKGKNLVSKCLTVLNFQQKYAIVLTLMSKLALLCDKTLYSGTEYAESETFWRNVVDIIVDPAFSLSCLESALLEFVTGHALNEVVTVLSSSYGCNVLYQLLCRAYNEGARDSGSMDWDASFGSFCEAILGSLGDIFDQTEDDVLVWRVVAILDELGKSHRKQLRSLLKLLLDEGRAPPPPTEG